MRKYGLWFCLFIVACPVAEDNDQAVVDSGQNLPADPTATDAGVDATGNFTDAGIALAADAGSTEDNITPSDAGAPDQNVSSSEDVTSICVEIESPDGGFLNDIGLVRAERDGQRITVTVTLFNVNCGITEFNLFMEETENSTVLKATVSPVNLSNDTPLTRCHCDMDVAAVYVDADDSLSSVTAYFFSEVVLDNVDAIPENGFIGEVPLQ